MLESGVPTVESEVHVYAVNDWAKREREIVAPERILTSCRLQR
jgi:hypothetical protein